METNTNDQGAIQGQNSDFQQQVVINGMGAIPEPNENNAVRKKYHSSAMYTANAWHSTMKHVKQHQNHTGLNL